MTDADIEEVIDDSLRHHFFGSGKSISQKLLGSTRSGRFDFVVLVSNVRRQLDDLAFREEPLQIRKEFVRTSTPASAAEIIIAKITPLFVLLSLMMLLALAVLKLVFRVPFHGSLLFVLFGGVLCILSGISLGTVIATLSKSAQQAQLTAFFINPPLSSLSGALNPVEAMPGWLQPLTVLNPIHHFATIARGSMLKGSGLATLWPNVLALLIFTLVLVALSIWRFRKQLS